MKPRLWLERTLWVLLILSGAAAAFGWYVFATARCEGFGCIGLGVLAMFTVGVETLALAIGALLIWLKRSTPGGVAPWLWALEVLLALPLVWFLIRALWRG